MLKYNLVAAIFFLASASAETPETSLPVKIYAGSTYNGAMHRVEPDGSCFRLPEELHDTLGSIDIPCGGDENSDVKTICTLYKDGYCLGEIVTFDHPHINMKNEDGHAHKHEAAGHLAQGIRCQIVDSDKAIANTNGHRSTESQQACNAGRYQK